MKRVLFLVAAVSVMSLAATAQDGRATSAPETTQGSKDRSWRRSDDGFWERTNVLTVGIANISGNGFHYGFGPLTIAYDH